MGDAHPTEYRDSDFKGPGVCPASHSRAILVPKLSMCALSYPCQPTCFFGFCRYVQVAEHTPGEEHIRLCRQEISPGRRSPSLAIDRSASHGRPCAPATVCPACPRRPCAPATACSAVPVLRYSERRRAPAVRRRVTDALGGGLAGPQQTGVVGWLPRVDARVADSVLALALTVGSLTTFFLTAPAAGFHRRDALGAVLAALNTAAMTPAR